MSLAKKNNIEDYLSQNKEWKYENNCISRNFSFNTYMDSINFVVSLAEIAEQQNHHPDLTFGWGYCKVKISTHAIKGLAESDFILAAKIDEI